MAIPTALSSYRDVIHDHLLSDVNPGKFSHINPWGEEALTHLLEFVKDGKTIRGSLALLSYEAFAKKKPAPSAITLAVALEFFHAAFLIHDDIMDKDDVRRGKPSIHAQVGESVAICMGDLAIFLAYEYLAKAGASSQLLLFLSEEFGAVSVAQMEDVAPREIPSKETVLKTYRFKTARYTFSVPLAAGAMLAGAPKEVVDQLMGMGEHIGILFQIRDDELDNNVPTVLAQHLPEIKSEHQYGAKQLLDTMDQFIDTKVLRELVEFVQTRTL